MQLELPWAFPPANQIFAMAYLRGILVSIGRCIAMVLIWNGRAGADRNSAPSWPLTILFCRWFYTRLLQYLSSYQTFQQVVSIWVTP